MSAMRAEQDQVLDQELVKIWDQIELKAKYLIKMKAPHDQPQITKKSNSKSGDSELLLNWRNIQRSTSRSPSQIRKLKMQNFTSDVI
jgi:hypothetical protein